MIEEKSLITTFPSAFSILGGRSALDLARFREWKWTSGGVAGGLQKGLGSIWTKN